LLVVDVGGFQRVALEICVQAAVIGVTAGLADVLAQCARHRHGRRLSDGLDRDLLEGGEVGEVVVVRPVGTTNPNAFDLVAVHTCGRPEAIGRVLLQGERAVTSDVHL
jgi:hypothetical protein